MSSPHVVLYSDGACKGNPGPGGYAAILQGNGRSKEIAGGSGHTTNNRMELQAVIAGLQALERCCQVTLVTDSRYVTTILNGGRARANLDLVQQVRQLACQHDINVQQIRGHSGHEMHERCDRLAVAAAAQQGQREEREPMVINFKQYGSIQALNQAFGDRWIYIGRANKYAGLSASPLANPFKVKEFGGRGRTLPHYRRWLWERIQAGDEAVSDTLKAIDEASVLVCYCKPGPCHGDVVKVAAAWVKKKRQQTAFVSGHRDLTPAEFYQHYQPKLDKAIASAPGASPTTNR